MDNLQQVTQTVVDQARTIAQARQITAAHAAGDAAGAQKIANSLSTEDLQRVKQHLEK